MTFDNLIRPKFESKKLEEDRESLDIVKVRLNFEERRMLNALKLYHNDKKDSSVLKKEAFKVYKQLSCYEQRGN
jgi:hypothetical protein